MTPDDEEIDAFVAATAALSGLTIDPAHRPGVLANMRLLLAHAAQVLGVPGGVDDETDG